MTNQQFVDRLVSVSKSTLYFNFEVDGEQAFICVDESLDEIYEKVKGSGE